MKSRLLLGSAVLASITAAIAGAAAAQRLGGHSWPGAGTQQGRKQPSMAISANDLMWNFFSSL